MESNGKFKALLKLVCRRLVNSGVTQLADIFFALFKFLLTMYRIREKRSQIFDR